MTHRNGKPALIAAGALLLLLCSCGSESSGSLRGDNDEEIIPIENPYAPGSGHYAGYEWAERTGGDCTTASQSFNEGCKEYHRQIDAQQ